MTDSKKNSRKKKDVPNHPEDAVKAGSLPDQTDTAQTQADTTQTQTDTKQTAVDTTDPVSTPTSHDDEQDSLTDDWAAAMAEQSATEHSTNDTHEQPSDHTTGRSESRSEDEIERTASSANADTPKNVSPAPGLFQPLTSDSVDGQSDIEMIMDIPVQMSVELGRTRMTIKSILQLGQGSIVELDGLAGEPMDIYVNGYLIAQGEVVVVDEKYGIRVTDIITPSDRINRLNNRR